MMARKPVELQNVRVKVKGQFIHGGIIRSEGMVLEIPETLADYHCGLGGAIETEEECTPEPRVVSMPKKETAHSSAKIIAEAISTALKPKSAMEDREAAPRGFSAEKAKS